MRAILSTTLLQLDGAYRYIVLPDAPDVTGVPHYVGHPTTRFLLDQAGAVYTPGLFQGIQPGESFYVAQLRDPRKGAAFTVDVPGIGPGDLKWGKVTRMPDPVEVQPGSVAAELRLDPGEQGEGLYLTGITLPVGVTLPDRLSRTVWLYQGGKLAGGLRSEGAVSLGGATLQEIEEELHRRGQGDVLRPPHERA